MARTCNMFDQLGFTADGKAHRGDVVSCYRKDGKLTGKLLLADNKVPVLYSPRTRHWQEITK